MDFIARGDTMTTTDKLATMKAAEARNAARIAAHIEAEKEAKASDPERD